ncbi:MAG: Ig-like domain-containing protein, partial [Pseudomonadota bacterium]|nr:Ig-like domain-containing protein [Pseudomonadota bacterium]
APTVSASEQGTRDVIALQATASDNVGVIAVAFYVDDILRGQDNDAPYQLDFDSTTLSNGTHTLIVRASDAALNEGVSTPVQFVIDNTPLPPGIFLDGFE